MKRLPKEKIELLQSLYKEEKIDDAVNITEEEKEHFLQYKDEYGSKPIIYLSIHSKASEKLINSYIDKLIGLGCIVRFYKKGDKYDSYQVKNSDLIIMFPYPHKGEFILGKGTESEFNIARKHYRRVVTISSDEMVSDILSIQKYERVEGASVDWLKTAFISEVTSSSSLKDIINSIKVSLSKQPRKIYFKQKIKMV